MSLERFPIAEDCDGIIQWNEEWDVDLIQWNMAGIQFLPSVVR